MPSLFLSRSHFWLIPLASCRMHILFILCFSIIVIAARGQEDPAVAVACQNAYALCAFANCTVNADLKTASCGCYSFTNPDSISITRVALIPDNDIRDETRKICNTSTSCNAPDNVNVAAVCNSIAKNTENGQLWPMADLVSTYAPMLETENGVEKDEKGVYIPTWSCPAAPGRFVPVCMLAPCVFLPEPEQNPYNFGTHNMTCTCPLVEADIAYEVFGGLQDPCSQKVVETGDHVTAAAGALLTKYENDTDYVTNAWAAVQVAFESSIGSSSSGGDNPAGNTSPTSGAGYAFFKGVPTTSTRAFLIACVFSLSLSGILP